jgi:hypothetical protein
VFGRTRAWKRMDAAGKVICGVRQLPREQWAVLIPGHHPGFITWETYEANTARLRVNWRPPRGHGGGAPREGAALLQGLLRCGRCGRRLESAWSNGRPACRCRHGYTSATRPDPKRPKNLYVREDHILPRLAALAIPACRRPSATRERAGTQRDHGARPGRRHDRSATSQQRWPHLRPSH